jgi:hypothetical protein
LLQQFGQVHDTPLVGTPVTPGLDRSEANVGPHVSGGKESEIGRPGEALR